MTMNTAGSATDTGTDANATTEKYCGKGAGKSSLPVLH